MSRKTYLLTAIALLFSVVAYIVYVPVSIDSDIVPSVRQLMQKYRTSITKKEYCVVIDYTLPIYKKRLWVVDLKSGEPVINSHVSHAWNSGLLYSTDCSNEVNSEKSSVGAFASAEAYDGQYGYAMRIRGLDSGINDNAYSRSIVFHESYWPWSRGCFMTLPGVNRQLIDLTCNGGLVYVRGLRE